MIAPLRARHRLMATALAVIVPMLYVLILGSRLGEPDEGHGAVAPTSASEVEGEVGGLAWRADDRLIFLPDGDPSLPDVLLYWSRGAPTGEDLPVDAHLLGALDGDAPRTLVAPPEGGGHLVAYSLAHARVVGSGPAPEEAR